MQFFVEFLREGGASSMVVLGLTVLALGLGLVLGVVALLAKRLPVAIWLAAPTLIAVMGGVGTLYNLRKVHEVMPMVDPSMRAVLAAAGLSESLTTVAMGLICAAALLVFSAGLAAIGTLFGQGSEVEFTFAPHQLAGGAAVAGAVMLVTWGTMDGSGKPPLLLAGALFLGGAATALAGIRAGTGDEALARRASGVAATGLSAMLAVLAAAGASLILADRETLQVLVFVDENLRDELTAVALAGRAAMTRFTGLGALLAVGLGLAAIVPSAPLLTERRVQIDLAISAFFALCTTAVCVGALWMGGDLRAEASRPPPAADVGNEAPPSPQ